MRIVENFNDGWFFRNGFAPEFASRFEPGQPVKLPHNAIELPYNYFDEKSYQRLFTYQKNLPWRDAFRGKELVLRFDAAMADAVVYLNGVEVVAHRDGYTPFEARLTGLMREGDNLITVRIDGSENPEIPPFGGQIDYLTYAGIYRDVWLEVRSPVFVENLKIETANVLAAAKSVSVRCHIGNPQSLPLEGVLTATLKDAAGDVLSDISMVIHGDLMTVHFNDLTGLHLWDLDAAVLYEIVIDIVTGTGRDRLSSKFGFRTAEFTAEGFRLNGQPLKLIGLNRHQSFPYAGYAMGRSAQEHDAELLKYTLKCNLVRTSHYPQSTWFLDHCDRIGLLVFEEIPGWQHIGGETWKRESIRNVRHMIQRDWNHPSIIIWGVRINESPDSHDFYVETNRLARELDGTRQTGGVRCITDSEMLEDLYTMNDFALGEEERAGSNRGSVPLRGQREVTGLPQTVPYLVTEFNGHMFPTKRQDQEQRQAEHVTRHLKVLNAAYGDPHIAGCIGWCMFDYNTHKDFGSGDRICYHGVMDMFREPKFAAYVYASQCMPADEIILKPVTYWARGERNIGGVLPLIVLSNCDEIELRYGNGLSKRAGPDRQNYPHLPHPPIVFDERHFSPAEMGLWGMSWENGTFTGYLDGQVVKTVHMVSDPVPAALQIEADRKVLSVSQQDSVRIIVRVLDQAGNILPFFDDTIAIRISGPSELIGPASLPMRNGVAGFWLKTSGKTGEIDVTINSSKLGEAAVRLKAVDIWNDT
ncbi:glycoside hydrolase family 2 protein [Pararhizobium sp.]|uniref:glycoside hydrolase family 2 protein n=1 Tax=Pararhizobium sp. TaxID=1977563 RepID=UPI002717F9ED|nr:glycoside hydrolase family 2 TIM barrel-domain containing protein [Pararhizobium sp.]MDO9415060.1 glycoside hydrolase family 2 TIM barrel-domain containing protein [Pararhizobium sp.]